MVLARAVVDDARARVEAGEAVTEEAMLADARRRAVEVGRSLLQPLVNATGVIVHTNLGRAPLGAGAAGRGGRGGRRATPTSSSA